MTPLPTLNSLQNHFPDQNRMGSLKDIVLEVQPSEVLAYGLSGVTAQIITARDYR
jgi:hypothetical protein